MKLPTKLYHYSSHQINELRQDFHDLHRTAIPLFQKPHGLWFSVEDFGEDDITWKSWCEADSFRLEHLKYKYAISICNEARILCLNTTEELETFGLKYQGNDPIAFKRSPGNPEKRPYIYFLDFDRLMKEYDGIIIAPYNWACRLMNPSTTWYYGWDCASGCIWNMNAIQSFTLESIDETVGDTLLNAISE